MSSSNTLESPLFLETSDCIVEVSNEGKCDWINPPAKACLHDSKDLIGSKLFSDWPHITILAEKFKKLSDFPMKKIAENFFLFTAPVSLADYLAAADEAGEAIRIKDAITKAAARVVKLEPFAVTARAIFDLAKELTGATSGYVALLNDTGTENEVLFLDVGCTGDCTVDQTLPMPIRGLRAMAYHSGRAVSNNDFGHSPHWKIMPPGHIPLRNVMFGPLNIGAKTEGIMGLANKHGDFSEADMNLTELLSGFCAVALRNSQMLDLLRDSEAKYRGVVEQLPGLTFVCKCSSLQDTSSASIEVTMVDGSAAFFSNVTGLTKDESMKDDGLLNLFAESDRKAILKGWHHALTTQNKSVSMEHSIVSDGNPNGPRWVRQSIISYDGSNLYGIMTDITETVVSRERQKEAELEIEKKRVISRLTGEISHYFNNVLTSALANNSMAISAFSKTENIHNELMGYLKDVEFSLCRASEISSQLLALSGHGTFAREPIDLNDIVIRGIDMRKHSGENVPIETHLFKSSLIILANYVQTTDYVLHELIRNSIEAGKNVEENRIFVSTSVEVIEDEEISQIHKLNKGEYAVLTVRDKGVGMSEEVLKNIFTPFFTTKSSEAGDSSLHRGLGLAVAHGYVQAHDGEMVATSIAGVGTVVKVYFPIVDASQSAGSIACSVQYSQPEMAHSVSMDRQVRRIRKTTSEASSIETDAWILVVDDEMVIRKVMEKILTKAGYRVILAVDGVDGVEKFKSNVHTLKAVILDLVMPRMDGYEAFVAMASIDPTIPIVISSGCDRDECMSKIGQSSPFVGFISKPFHPKRLVNILKGVVKF